MHHAALVAEELEGQRLGVAPENTEPKAESPKYLLITSTFDASHGSSSVTSCRILTRESAQEWQYRQRVVGWVAMGAASLVPL